MHWFFKVAPLKQNISELLQDDVALIGHTNYF